MLEGQFDEQILKMLWNPELHPLLNMYDSVTTVLELKISCCDSILYVWLSIVLVCAIKIKAYYLKIDFSINGWIGKWQQYKIMLGQ